MSKKRCLLGIDWQDGFCHQVLHPDVNPDKDDLASAAIMAKNGEYQQQVHDGELFVPNSPRDAENCAKLIREGKPEGMILTFDSHDTIHCSFPTYYDPAPPVFCFIRVNPDKNAPSTARFQGYYPNDPDKIIWEGTTRRREWADGHAEYLTALAATGRFPHCIWPPHCIVGTPSWGLVDPIAQAYTQWEAETLRKALKITKGNNREREHFGAPRAQIVHDKDPSTDVNTTFIQALMQYDEIWLTGEALYHCMWTTVWDTANLTSKTGDFDTGAADDLANHRTNPFLEKCVLFYDPKGEDGCTSPVPGVVVPEQDQLLDRAKQLGLKITTVSQYLS